jgi:hypothetical protein
MIHNDVMLNLEHNIETGKSYLKYHYQNHRCASILKKQQIWRPWA